MPNNLIAMCICGATPDIKRRRYEDGDTLIWVECPACKSEGNNNEKQSKAIESWNRKQGQ